MNEKLWSEMTQQEQDKLLAENIARAIQRGGRISNAKPYCAICGYIISGTSFVPFDGFMNGHAMHQTCADDR